MQHKLTLTLATLLLAGTGVQAQYPYPPPPPRAYQDPAYAQDRYLRTAYDKGYDEGRRAGFDNRGGSGAPGWLTSNLKGDFKKAFKRGYHDGFGVGQAELRAAHNRPHY